MAAGVTTQELTRAPAASTVDRWKLLAIMACHAVAGAVVFRYGTDLQDEGLLYVWARRILEGDLPYTDFYLVQLPGTFYVQAAFMKLFGFTMLGGRIFKQVEALLMIWLVYAVVRSATRDLTAARVAAFATAVLSCALHFRLPWYGLEACMGLLAGTWAVCAWVTSGRAGWLALAGVCLGLSTFIKQNHGVLGIIALSAFVAWHAARRAAPGRKVGLALLNTAVLGAGVIGTLGSYFAYYVAAGGSLERLLLNCYVWASEAKGFPTALSTALGPFHTYLLLHKGAIIYPLSALVFCAGAALAVARRAPRWLRAVGGVAVLGVAALGPDVVVRVLMFPFCGLLVVAIGVAAVVEAARQPADGPAGTRAMTIACVALAALANLYAGTIPGGGWGRLVEALPGTLPAFGVGAALLRAPGLTRALWEREVWIRPRYAGFALGAATIVVSAGLLVKNQAFRPTLDVAFGRMTATGEAPGWRGLRGDPDFIRDTDAVIERLASLPPETRANAYVFPLNCALYLLADLHNPTSFDSHQVDFLAPSQFPRLMSELEQSRPSVIVLHRRPNASELAPEYFWVRPGLWPMVDEFVSKNYRLGERLGVYELWFPREPGGRS
ncbi:MAG: glycosyltransferase family 39 protein [Myxococcales bacterium]|nr:glycosyltransferase family 39 protein [Myxococcales bacterium]